MADILIRNLKRLEVTEIENLTKPSIFSGNKILLKTVQAVLENLKNLADKKELPKAENYKRGSYKCPR